MQKFNRNLDEIHEIRQKSIGNPEITVKIKEITLEISFLQEIILKSIRNQDICLKSLNLFLKSSDFEISYKILGRCAPLAHP